MIKDEKIWIANQADGTNVSIIPKMANRHGLVAGATGTGKTVTLKVMAESFSEMGVPVFMADVKGDIAGMMNPGTDSEDMQNRIARFGLDEAGFEYKGCPVTLWDIYGKSGIPLRTTISEMGPLLLSRILNLNDLQSDILSIIFKIADDNSLLLIDTKDLKAILAYVDSHSADFAADYGKISSASIGVITRAIVALETAGGDIFFGEPALNISDMLQIGAGGKGMINVLSSESLIGNTRLYSTFLLWLLSELFETLPEVGDMSRPKMVFFFDEAHLLFSDAPKVLLDKIEQVVKLIRSKGVGVYFCTQNPRDIPDSVLAQLSNKVQHGLRAYTPSDQKAVKAAADSFRVNPDFDTFDTILNLGTGEAVVSFLMEDGVPQIAQKVNILPPQCSMSAASEAQREQCMKESLLYSKYSNAYDPDSAYEFLLRKGLEEQQLAEEQKQAELEEKEAAKQAEREEREAAKQAEREEKEAAKQAERERKEAEKQAEREKREAEKQAEKEKKEAEKKAEKERKAKAQAIHSVGNTVAGTVGREAGKQFGKNFGRFGKLLGGNVGASLGRGILSTLFKK